MNDTTVPLRTPICIFCVCVWGGGGGGGGGMPKYILEYDYLLIIIFIAQQLVPKYITTYCPVCVEQVPFCHVVPVSVRSTCIAIKNYGVTVLHTSGRFC